ncbi:MAG TPA: hypothetical protein PLD20_24450 [Blastocatellia bacterium]|nr:hypothetical protein [Blastocatellia bacterium]HMX27523.1 hypothetical protein [Blastocatellia bacterium]HMY73433.1 hypothetical protein [Blastocatellia bacterium]HMZ21107.1 hypothetical protein [Blastocatellia bacterium]HNG34079.1 hypothetical protein [Blastocatellia bacterium]
MTSTTINESRQTAIANLHMLKQYASGEAKPKKAEDPQQRYNRVLSFVVTGSCAPDQALEKAAYLATRWQVGTNVVIEAVSQADGGILYAVRGFGNDLNKAGEWELPPSPSSVDAEWLQSHRWDTFDEAFAAATKALA